MHPFDNVIPSVWSAHDTSMPIFSTGYTVLKKNVCTPAPLSPVQVFSADIKACHFHCLKFLLCTFFWRPVIMIPVNSTEGVRMYSVDLNVRFRQHLFH